MKLSLNWLNEYVKVDDINPRDLADRLDLTGTAVEAVVEQGKGLDNVVTGKILKINPHPNADKLTVCEVSIGNQTLQIVCGAKNMKEGDVVPVAMVGAVLPGNFKIKKAKIRGEESFGMLCSEVELGLSDNATGIMILPDNLNPGEPMIKVLGLTDTILELEITPNRPDCMSMIGMAREIGAILNRPYKVLGININEEIKEAKGLVEVEIVDGDLCPRYCAKVISDVAVGQSPDWMKKRLIAAGARPINNIVDVTNYVLFEMGQPLHAFDYELIKEGKIIIRKAMEGEKITTLDGIKRTLLPDNLLIADPSGPIALAGVMGGSSTEVSEQTKVILLESAYFNPINISRTSRSLGLISESSIRFERGIDPNGCLDAASRAAMLIQQLAGGKVLKGTVDKYPNRINPVYVDVTKNRVNSILGTDITSERCNRILKSLDLKVNVKIDRRLQVEVPTFRPDLEREIDLIEEIARIYGLNNIESTLPKTSEKVGALNYQQSIEARIRELMIAGGLTEALTYSFINPDIIEKIPLLKEQQNWVKIANPITEDQKVLRTTLLGGLLNAAQFNINRGQNNVRLFEIGKVFSADGSFNEKTNIAGIISGKWQNKQWYSKDRKLDFFDLKGILEVIFKDLRVSSSDFVACDYPFFKVGNSATVDVGPDNAGYIGEIDPDILASFDIENSVFYFELDLGSLINSSTKDISFTGIPRFPGISLDVAVLVDQDVTNAQVLRAIKEAGGHLLKSVRLFDVYSGKGIPEGQRSLAYSLSYQDFEKTLTMEEATNQHQKVIKALNKEIGAMVR